MDASGHISEETQNARYVSLLQVMKAIQLTQYTFSVMAGRGLYLGAFATGIGGFCTTILFLFCTPNIETLFALSAPQPFVQIYALALGKGPSTFMTLVAAIAYSLVSHPPSFNL